MTPNPPSDPNGSTNDETATSPTNGGVPMTDEELQDALGALDALGYLNANKVSFEARRRYARAFNATSELVEQLERDRQRRE